MCVSACVFCLLSLFFVFCFSKHVGVCVCACVGVCLALPRRLCVWQLRDQARAGSPMWVNCDLAISLPGGDKSSPCWCVKPLGNYFILSRPSENASQWELALSLFH